LPEESSSRPSRRPPPPPDEQRRPRAGCRGPHCPHHGRPANAEVTSDRGHRVGRPCRPADRPERGLVGLAPPWDGSGPPAGPGAYPAGWRTTAPDPLAPGSITGQPPLGRSRTRTVRRPWSSARAPRPLKSTAVAVVWTANRHSPPATTGGEDLKPSKPSSLEADALLVDPPGASCLADVSIRKIGEVPGAVQAAPTSSVAAHRPTVHDESRSICERVPRGQCCIWGL
jgi:hypothetical protein